VKIPAYCAFAEACATVRRRCPRVAEALAEAQALAQASIALAHAVSGARSAGRRVICEHLISH
jgi:hypothetical protein